MKTVDRYFSLKIIKRDNSIKKPKNSIHSIEKARSKSNEDLLCAETEEAVDRSEETKLAEEAYAANIKLLKKQKARFLRLQKILSRNVILIPLCAIFSLLSAASLFISTLSDHYELISYDVNLLRRHIELENNNSLNQINSIANLNLTLADFLSNNKRHEKPSFDLNSEFEYVKDATTKKPASQRNLLTERLQSFFVYEITNIIKDYHVVTRRNFMVTDNSTLKTNILYETHSGIWKQCNYLSGEFQQIRHCF